MPEEFVCLRSVEFKRWADPRPENISDDDAPAWCLKNLSPNAGANALSMFLIPTNRSEELAPMVAAALGALCENLRHAEFILFDANLLTFAGLSMQQVPGETPIEEVNKLHVDVTVSARLAATLASTIYGKATVRRLLVEKVKEHLVEAKQAGRLDLTHLNKKVREALEAA